MKHYDIVTLFKREVKCDKDFQQFRKTFKLSGKALHNLHYDGYIDYCYKCRSYHYKTHDREPLFKSNLSWCDNCMLGYSREKEMKFIRTMLNLRQNYSQRGVSVNVKKK